jgi:hypothetical protein
MAAAPLVFNIAEQAGSLIMGLLATHDKRVKLAQAENAAVAQAVTAFDHDIQTIFSALNAGDITEQVASKACADVEMWYWVWITPFSQNQNVTESMCNSTVLDGGRGAASDNPPGCGSSAGDKTCTSACCIGCAVIVSALRQAENVIAKHGGTVNVPGVVANKYGLPARAAYNISYIKPKVKNPEAAVTLNTKTGTLSVGAPPSASDILVSAGLVNTQASPDTGEDVIPHNAAGQDAGTTFATVGPSIGGLSSNVLLLVIAGAVGIFLLARD